MFGRMFGEKKYRNWRRASLRDFSDIIEFLRPREHSCISVTSRLSEGGKPLSRLLRQNDVLIERQHGRVCSLIMLSADGIISPYLQIRFRRAPAASARSFG